MDIGTLATFFMWCTIFNVVILIVSTVVFAAAPDFVYRVQTKFFPMPRESFNVIVYGSLAIYRVIFVVFVFVPYLALVTIR